MENIHLAEFRFAYNTSLQATLAFLNFGRKSQPVNRGRRESAIEVAEANPENWREHEENPGFTRLVSGKLRGRASQASALL